MCNWAKVRNNYIGRLKSQFTKEDGPEEVVTRLWASNASWAGGASHHRKSTKSREGLLVSDCFPLGGRRGTLGRGTGPASRH